MNYKIDSIVGGDCESTGDKRYVDLVTVPGGKTVVAGQGTAPYSDGDKQVKDIFTEADWTSGQTAADDWMPYPLKEVLVLSRNPQYTRYASVDVKLTMGESTRTYKALFLFGFQDQVLAVDFITGNSLVSWMVSQSVYPHALLETRMRLDPITIQWLSNAQTTDGRCSVGQEAECCDVVALRCGITSADVESTFAIQAARPELSGILPRARAAKARLAEGAQSHSSNSFPNKVRPDDDLGCSSLGFSAPGDVDTDSDASQHLSGNHS